MSVRQIKTYGKEVLRRKAKPITDFDPELEMLVRDMFQTMYASNGIGLAAPQVGISKRLIVIDIEEIDSAYPPLALVNPELSDFEGEIAAEEGCLSFPGLQGCVNRAQKLHLRAQTPKGDNIEFEAEDWMARVLQHEVDHLNGVLFIDHVEKQELRNMSENLQRLKEGKPPLGDPD